MKSSKAYDSFDFSLLRALQRHGRATNAELSQSANLSESSCLRRVRQLEADGVIQRYAAIIAPDRIGFRLNAFVTITLVSQSEAALKEFEREVARIDEVMECFLMTGSADYLIHLVARDVDDLERLHAIRLTRLPNVARVTSSIAMREVVRRTDLPVHEID
ncbi:MAG: Lrp/AsnC family transcriptional regulator [Novosphingobium sp.]|nr:Lrp/AsnC family transcriptional regulator [Novosphingobium sp.]